MTAARSFHEPAEREDPRNVLLDLAERAMETAIDQGLAPQLEARLVKLIGRARPAASDAMPAAPAVPAAPADPVPAAVPVPAPAMPAAVGSYTDIDRAIRLVNAAATLGRVARRSKLASERDACNAAREMLVEELNALRIKGGASC